MEIKCQVITPLNKFRGFYGLRQETLIQVSKCLRMRYNPDADDNYKQDNHANGQTVLS